MPPDSSNDGNYENNSSNGTLPEIIHKIGFQWDVSLLFGLQMDDGNKKQSLTMQR
jgi:hypothetical protein